MKVPISSNILEHGYRSIISYTTSNPTPDDLEITYEISDGIYSISFRKLDWSKFAIKSPLYNKIKYTSNHVKRRNELIKSLFSKSPDLISEAEQIIKDIII